MAAKLEKIYNIIEEKLGNNGRLKFAQLTKIPRTQAVEMDDAPEMVAVFKRIASEMLGKNIDELH
ncbi:MAG: hypothetical protein QG657_1384 [Acidobacteriota bacterium]|nr:hypothetical protein [Acidobacteriota bacterium]